MDSIQLILSRWLNATPKVVMVILIISVFVGLIFSKKIGFLRRLPAALCQKRFWCCFLPLAAVGALVFFDTRIMAWAQALEAPLVKAWIQMGAHLGRWVWLYVAVAYWLSRLLRKTHLARVLSFSLAATVVTAAVVHGFKFLIARARPFENLGAFSWFNYDGGLQDRRGFQSFPSGDVAVVAAVAFFFFHATPSRVWRWCWLLFPLATAFSRVTLNKHWPSDAFASWIFANAFAWLFYKLMQREALDEAAAKETAV